MKKKEEENKLLGDNDKKENKLSEKNWKFFYKIVEYIKKFDNWIDEKIDLYILLNIKNYYLLKFIIFIKNNKLILILIKLILKLILIYHIKNKYL